MNWTAKIVSLCLFQVSLSVPKMLGKNFQANRQNRNRAYYNVKDNEAVSYNSQSGSVDQNSDFQLRLFEVIGNEPNW